MGNPLLLPVSALSTGLENADYNRQRAVVKDWITRHETTLRAEQFNGPLTQSLLDTLPASAHPQVRADLRAAAKHPDFTERATISVMVHRP